MIRSIRALTAVGCLLMSACIPDASPEMDQAARTAIAQTRAGDTAALKTNASSEILAASDEAIIQVGQLMPSVEPDSIERIGFHSQTMIPDGPNSQTLTYEYNWPDRAALVGVMYVQPTNDAVFQFNGLNVRVATREELDALDFNFFSKTPAHYAMLLAVIASVGLMIAAFVLSIRTPGIKRRWLWCIASLATVLAFTMNWSTGEFAVGVLNGGLINSGVSRASSQFAPWLVSTSFPIGAIVVMLRLRKRRRDAALATKTETAA